jgi:hypothetical protein
MLSWINFMFTMFEDYFISIGPFINTPSTASWNLIILAYMTTH